MPSINPQGGPDGEGVFATYIGVDTTSIQATVTLGSSAIAVYLLGCMLARIFTGLEAILVQVKLVKMQKVWIFKKQQDNLYSYKLCAAISVSQQDISRSDLASWDASAQAWLQSADQAKASQHKKTMLILSNVGLPVNNKVDTYKSVIKAQTAALEAMDNLVKGIQQTVYDRAAFLAILSWHLYPDIAIFGSSTESYKEVKLKDPIFGSLALLTLRFLEHV